MNVDKSTTERQPMDTQQSRFALFVSAIASKSKRFLASKFKKIIWLIGLGWLTFWVWTQHKDLLATDWMAGGIAAAFAITALCAGSPYVWRHPERWVWRIRRVPEAENKAMRMFPWIYGKITSFEAGLFRKTNEPWAMFTLISLFFAVSILCGTASIPWIGAKLMEDLSIDLRDVTAYDPVVSTEVFSADNERICVFTREDRIRVPIETIPQVVKDAFTAAEDQRFYEHHGIDVTAIFRAALANYKSKRTKQGGSTITQQVVKQVILQDTEKSFIRKAREMLIARELERTMEIQFGEKAKDMILGVYLNHIFLGHGTYGVQSASRAYFGKDVGHLTVAEAAILAGLPQAPSRDSPFSHFDRAKQRQAYVLGRMEELSFIDHATRMRALREPIFVIERDDPLNRTAAPYFCEHVRKELKRLFGNDAIYNEGLTVYTTLDMRMQRVAEASVRTGLVDLERRLGFAGSEGHDPSFTGEASCVQSGIQTDNDITGIARVASIGRTITVCLDGNVFPLDKADQERVSAWQTKSGGVMAVGDLVSVRIVAREETEGKTLKVAHYALLARRTGGEGHPDSLQASLIAVDPKTGHLKAMVGGYDFSENQFNNATQARRQTGSSIKPYVYLTALMHGTTVTRIMNDHPVCYPTASGIWCPKNYSGPRTVSPYKGSVDLRTALAMSLNSISVQLIAESGVDEVIRTMRKLGIESPIERVMPVAVGAADLTLYEHTYAYTSISTNGKTMPRHPNTKTPGVFITKILDANKRTVFPSQPFPLVSAMPQAVPAADAYSLVYLMKGVVENGTGRRVRELRRPAAGKTGTTNSFRDVWFMGFTADLVAGVWVGRTTPEPIAKEATGGSVALPIWLAFMKAAHPDTPAREFPVPLSDVSLIMNTAGQLVPYPRGRIPQELLGRTGVESE